MTVHLIAHRGDCHQNIENTLASINAAIDAGITAIEIDIQLTKDAIPVLFHDRTLFRLTNTDVAVPCVNYQKLRQFKFEPPDEFTLQNRHRKKTFIATLQEVVNLIAQYPNVQLFVEVKRINFLYFSYQKVLGVLINYLQSILPQVTIISFSYRFLLLYRRLIKNNTKEDPGMRIGYVLPHWQQYSKKMLARLKPQYIFCDIEFVPNSFNFEVDLKSNKVKWVLYEISDVEIAKHYLDRGVTHLETFFPEKLKEQLIEKGFYANNRI